MHVRRVELACLSGLILSGFIGATPSAGAPGPPVERLHRVSHSAMGSEVTVQAYTGDPEALRRVMTEAFAEVDRLDRRWSLYRPDSELARLNREGGSQSPVALAPDLWELVETAAEVHGLTGGAFDITVGPLVRLWGFLDGRPHWPRPEELEASRGRVGLTQVALDPVARTLRFRRPAMELDLGGIAKGFAVDLLADRLRRSGVERFLVDFGGSSQYALGAPPSQAGWYLYLRPTWDDRLPMRRLVARDLALSTSGNDQRFWAHEGRIYGHVLDPRTGRPTPHRGSVSVIAPSATLGDALSTAFLVMGFEDARHLIERHPEWGAVFYSPDEGWRAIGAAALENEDPGAARSEPNDRSLKQTEVCAP